MANNNTTLMSFYCSNPDTVKWLNSVFNNPSEDEILDVFTDAGLPYIDRVGTKWWYKNDWQDYSDHEFYLNLDSAWYPCWDLIKGVWARANDMDGDVWVKGHYYDEAFDPVGVFYIDQTGELYNIEETPDSEWGEYEDENPDGSYFDDVIDPLVQELFEDLDIPDTLPTYQ